MVGGYHRRMEVDQSRNDFKFVDKCFFYQRIREEKLEVMIVLRDWITIDIYADKS